MENVMITSTGLRRESQVGARPVDANREETAVYVGRAFFRMARATEDGQDSVSDLGAFPAAGLVGETEEHVVLSPPSLTVVVAEQGDDASVASVADVADSENAGPSEGVLVPTGMRSVPRRIPMWPVATALVVGAFATLSAQAVMRRTPRAPATAATTATLTTTATTATSAIAATIENHGPSAQSDLIASHTSTAAVLADSGPLVAPSTLTAWNTKARISPEPRRTNRIQLSINSAERTPHARALRSATNNSGGTTWVDPFASIKATPKAAIKPAIKVAPRIAAKPATKVEARPAQKNAWVDPFAN